MKTRYLSNNQPSGSLRSNDQTPGKISCKGQLQCSKAFLMLIAILVITSETLFVNAQVIPLPKWDDDEPLPPNPNTNQADISASI